jgi:glycosyltransferase involved in cell wall biosynthesis
MHVIGGLGVGGAERMLERLVVAQREAGLAQSLVMSLTGTGVIGARLREAGFEVRALGARSVVEWPIAVARVAWTITRWQPDILQTWLYHADLVGGMAGRLARHRAKVVWNIRCSEFPAGLMMAGLIAANARASTRLSDSIICCGEVARKIHIAKGYDAARMVVIPNGFVIDHWPLAQGTAQNCHFVAIGRDDPVKGFDLFIRAAAKVAPAMPRARFALHGRGVDANPAYRTLIARAGLTGVCELHGETDDVSGVLRGAQVFVSASHHEGFPNVVAEAMLTGLPVVATDAGDSALILGEAGRIVPPGDVGALAAAMLDLARMSPEERAQIGHAGRERILQHFDIGRIAQTYAGHYRALLAKEA